MRPRDGRSRFTSSPSMVRPWISIRKRSARVWPSGGRDFARTQRNEPLHARRRRAVERKGFGGGRRPCWRVSGGPRGGVFGKLARPFRERGSVAPCLHSQHGQNADGRRERFFRVRREVQALNGRKFRGAHDPAPPVDWRWRWWVRPAAASYQNGMGARQWPNFENNGYTQGHLGKQEQNRGLSGSGNLNSRGHSGESAGGDAAGTLYAGKLGEIDDVGFVRRDLWLSLRLQRALERSERGRRLCRSRRLQRWGR